MKKAIKLFTITAVLINLISILLIIVIPKGNFIAGPATVFLFIVPILLLQLLVLFINSRTNNEKTRYVSGIFSILFFLLSIFFSIRYFITTT